MNVYQRTGVSFAPPERVGARESAKSAQGSGVAQGVTPLPGLRRIVCSWCHATIRQGITPTTHAICATCKGLL